MINGSFTVRWAKEATAALATILMLSSTSTATAGIQGSVHDFSQQGWTGGEFCIVCHTPHDSSNHEQAPLWNHTTSNAVYELYSSPSLVYEPEQPGPGNLSRLCLSCHDGTVAIDSFGGTGGSTTVTGRANLGTNLRDDHPVGVYWDHQTGTSNLTCNGVCHKLEWSEAAYAYVFTGEAGQEIKFYNRRVECPSCHDVHNVNVEDVKLLRKTMAGSQLCLHCHPK